MNSYVWKDIYPLKMFILTYMLFFKLFYFPIL